MKMAKDSLDTEDKELMEVLESIGIGNVKTSREFIEHLEALEKEKGIAGFGGKEKVIYKDKFDSIFKSIVKYVKSSNFFTTGIIRQHLIDEKELKETTQVRKRKGKEKKVKVLVTNDKEENVFSDNVMRALLNEMCKDKIVIRWLPPEDSDDGWTTRDKKNEKTGEVTTYKIPIKTAYFINPKHDVFKGK